MVRTRTVIAALAIAALLGCSEGERVKRLESEIAALRASVERLDARVAAAEKAERSPRWRGETGVRGGAPSAIAEPAGGAPPADDGTPKTDGQGDPAADAEAILADPERLAAALATETGQQVVEGVVRGMQVRRERERRSRVARAVVGVFAADNDLSPGQADDVSKLLTGAADEIQDVWAKIRRSGDDTGSMDMGARVQAAVQRTLEIRRAANERARDILTADQHARFLEDADRLHDSLRPGDAGRRAREGEGRPSREE